MGITYTRLFHLMLDLGIKKGELQKKANITASIMARLARNESVRTENMSCFTLSTRRYNGLYRNRANI